MLQITKQSVNDLVRDMEERGYLVRVPDPNDGRARIIRLTAKGHRLEQAVYEAAGSAEQTIAHVLGPRRFAQMRESLDQLAQQITAGDMPTMVDDH